MKLSKGDRNVETVLGLIRMLTDKIERLAEDGAVGDLARVRELLLDEVAGDEPAKRNRVEANAADYHTVRGSNGKRIRISIPA